MGKIPARRELRSDNVTLVTSLLARQACMADLWNLDSLGITDPAESKSRRDLEKAAMDHFRQTVRKDDHGRYEVSLPWIEGHAELPDNRGLAEKRLRKTVTRLQSDGIADQYQELLNEWLTEGIIEEVPESEISRQCHYLPHRAVVKLSSQTTKIRPVFDASAKEKNKPSLNDCLERGPNLLELIPSVLLRFRLNCIGVVSDIKRAFLQIGLVEHDRDFLRFLWWENGKEENYIEYRHRRVVFGVCSSPFLLGATLRLHLENAPDSLQDTALQLRDSLYVDNCVASVDNDQQMRKFIGESQVLLSSAKFELHDWCNGSDGSQSVPMNTSGRDHSDEEAIRDQPRNAVAVLGLLWDPAQDTIGCDLRTLETPQDLPVTKKMILSVAHKIFDPIGFACPVVLCPKLLLQEAWSIGSGWDDELPSSIAEKFKKWLTELPLLSEVKIPRYVWGSPQFYSGFTLHTFCDASRYAYATCIFLRVETHNQVSVQLLQARARVAPVKSMTIPRLELMACCIGSRLAASIKMDLRSPDIPVYYWSDSTTALCWIKRENLWGVFVSNRVKEILNLSKPENWYHVPGDLNPADLPSRGCSVRQLVKSKWWEGPDWLKLPEVDWPKGGVETDEDVVNEERKKTVVSAHSQITSISPNWFCERFSSFIKIVRMLAWMLRFYANMRLKKDQRQCGELTSSEIQKAEIVVFRLIQRESFQGKKDENLSSLQPFEGDDGVLRLKTRIMRREDTQEFKHPIVLPDQHPAVRLLIAWRHRELSHAGVQVLMTDLRERYWIIKSRKTIRQVI